MVVPIFIEDRKGAIFTHLRPWQVPRSHLVGSVLPEDAYFSFQLIPLLSLRCIRIELGSECPFTQLYNTAF